MYNFLQGFNFGFASSMFNNMFGFFSPCCFNFGGLFNTSIFGMNSFGFGFGNYSFDYGNSIFAAPQISMSPQLQMPVDMSMTCCDTVAFSNYNLSQSLIPAYSIPTITRVDKTADKSDSKTAEKTDKKASTPKTVSKPSDKTDKLEHWTEMSDARMKEIYGNYDFDVTTKFKGTADDLNKYLNKTNGVLKGKGETFMKAQEKYGINALVLIAISKAETSCGERGHAVDGKYNIGNIRKNRKEWMEYKDADEAIMGLAEYLKEKYVVKPNKEKTPVEHLTKLYQIASKYCPAGADGNGADWAKKVQGYVYDIKNAIA